MKDSYPWNALAEAHTILGEMIDKASAMLLVVMFVCVLNTFLLIYISIKVEGDDE